PINLGAIAAAQLTTFVLTVTTSSGTYSGNVNVSITLPFMVATGLADVPIQVPVLVHGKKAASYSWTMTAPSGSKAALADASTQDTYFTPDVAGKYTLKEATTGASLDIFGGTFVGALSGSDAKGQPLSASCTICHNGTLAPDNFTTWKTTGHAVVFTRAIGNTADHYAETCLACHSVGYEALGAKNNGINDQTDFAALQATGMLAAPTAANWAKILATYPKSATFTNIQCENCHGPNSSDTGLHPDGKIDAARVSLSSDVCGVCHGRPPTHSLFQQWQLSPHSNFVTASAESTNTSCARCHTAQGFLVWIKQADMTVSLTAAQLASANMTPDTAQPITCVVCHDPHDEGDMMATPPDPKVRIEGNTSMLPSGYQAIAVGKGAICITCHNTRNTAHNDSTGLRATTDQAPHSAAQGDVLLGENAYFVKTGIRGAHSLLEDTCATCHVEASPPPAPYTTASNHSFAASADICGDCHGAFKNGENLMAATEAKLVALGNKLASYTLSKLPATFMITDAISASNPTLIAKSNVKSLTPVEAHGRQGFTVTFVTPVKFTAATGGAISTLSEAEFQLSSLTAEDKTLVIPATDPLYKAGWNYWLIESDSSKGVHNPSWVSSVIQGAIDALK
ncbi:MAG: hypothetical protein Q7T05_08815, partial [Dehalococcoidia bacterium]|nr:hypothetical protein [Dehalococcoidia bacterium]